jgi:AraC-like DNA-binding protein
LPAVIEYREFAPSRELHPAVACRWQRSVPEDAASRSALILPDGCVDLIWRGEQLLVAGPDRSAVRSPTEAGQLILGLRMRPGVAGAALGVPAEEILDQRPSLEQVLGRPGAELGEMLAEAAERETAFGMMEAFVASQVRATRPDALVLTAIRKLGFRGGGMSDLAETLGISERQLRRRFRKAVGYGPKTLDRVLRFRHLVSQIQAVRAGEVDLARFAADVGYADQAHMTRDCVGLSGLTPTRLAALWTR